MAWCVETRAVYLLLVVVHSPPRHIYMLLKAMAEQLQDARQPMPKGTECVGALTPLYSPLTCT